MLPGHGGQRSQTIPGTRADGPGAAEVHGPAFARHAGVSRGSPRRCADAAANIGIWLQRLVGRPAERPLAQGDGPELRRRSAAGDPPRGRLLLPASQTHDERQTRRSRVRESPPPAQTLEKRALEPASSHVLIFQDEMEIHRHPALTRMWAPVGQQPEVPAPGKNEKQVVYGGVNYQTGKLTYTLAATKCGAAFLTFLMGLVKQYVGQHIILVCDNGRFHKTQAVEQWLNEHRAQITV